MRYLTQLAVLLDDWIWDETVTGKFLKTCIFVVTFYLVAPAGLNLLCRQTRLALKLLHLIPKCCLSVSHHAWQNFSLNSVTSVVNAEDCKNLRVQENSKDIQSLTCSSLTYTLVHCPLHTLFIHKAELILCLRYASCLLSANTAGRQ